MKTRVNDKRIEDLRDSVLTQMHGELFEKIYKLLPRNKKLLLGVLLEMERELTLRENT